MPGLSIHVVDVSRGIVATGMRVEVHYTGKSGTSRELVADGYISKDGALLAERIAERQQAGGYEALFHVGLYYRDAGVALASIPFLDVVRYGFGISDPEQHYHLPFKCTPWGYSCFRGGV